MILITGATSGIGKALCYSYAKKGYDLFITSRKIELLNEIKKDIESKYNVKVITFKCDLVNENEIIKMYNEAIKYEIEVVINNSGIGDINRFSESEPSINQNIIDVNCKGLTMISRLFTDYFIKANVKHKVIINVASIGAYVSGSYMAVYYASKKYVLNLSLALNHELKKHKIKVKCVIPNTTNTNFFKAINPNVKIKNKGVSPFKVSEVIVKHTFDRLTIISIGLKTKLSIFALRFLPETMVASMMEKALKKRLS